MKPLHALLVSLALAGVMPAHATTRIVSFSDCSGTSTANLVNTNVLNQVIDRILALTPSPQVVVVSGDMLFNRLTGTNYAPFTNTMQRLRASGIPYYCAIGNQDTGYNSSSQWYNQWSAAFPWHAANGPAGWTRLAYYVDTGAARLVFLDSVTTGSTWVASTPIRYQVSGTQKTWLDSVIGTHSTQTFDIVVSHFPAFATTTNACLDNHPTERDALVQSLVNAGVSAYLTGHEHLFSRRTLDTRYNAAWTNPVPQIGTCAGSPLTTALSTNLPVPDAMSTSNYCYTVIDLDPATLSGTATTYDLDGTTVLDTVTLAGKVPPAPPPPALSLSFTNTIFAESTGLLPSWAAVHLPSAQSSNVTVTLTGSDPSELAITNELVIASNQTSAVFDLLPLRDSEYDGTRPVQIVASAPGFTPATGRVEVADCGGGSVSLVATGAVWRYDDTGTNPPAGWQGTNFDDSAWASGPAKLGYGQGDEATTIGFGGDATNKSMTAYFRRTFVMNRGIGLDELRLRCLRDDGIVVYLNGSEVFRDNMPTGTVEHGTAASSDVDGTNESAFVEAVLPHSALILGTNVIAAEVHQSDPASDDLGFDLSLDGYLYPRVSFAATTAVDRFTLARSLSITTAPYVDNYSGCCLLPSSDQLLVVVNRTLTSPYLPRLLIFDRDLTYRSSVQLTGFDDAEGICAYDMDRGLFGIVEESYDRITIVPVTSTTTNIIQSTCTTIPFTLPVRSTNETVEGITYDPLNACFYAVKEKNPMGIYRIRQTDSGSQLDILFASTNLFPTAATNDLSDITYDPLTGHLFILSDLRKRVLECDMAGHILQTLLIPQATQPEGIWLSDDRQTLFVCGEPNQIFEYHRNLPLIRTQEGTNLTFTATLSVPWTNTLTADWGATSATAIVDVDYSPAGGTLVWTTGQTTASFNLDVPDDGAPERSETVMLSLTNTGVAIPVADTNFAVTIEGRVVQLIVESPAGLAWPPAGTNEFEYLTELTCRVTNSPVAWGAGTQLVCTGWVGTASVPISGSETSTPPFQITNDSTLVWLWDTNFWLGVATNGRGSVAGGNLWLRPGAGVSLQATNAPYAAFAGWTGDVDGMVSNSPELDFTMDRTHDLVARFTSENTSNGIPLWWLADFYGTNGDFESLSTNDSDGDGATALAEYIGLSDPTNAESLFAITAVAPVSNGITIRWPGAEGRTYTLYRSTNVAESWPGAPVLDPISGVAGTNSVTVTNSTGEPEFYRVGAELTAP